MALWCFWLWIHSIYQLKLTKLIAANWWLNLLLKKLNGNIEAITYFHLNNFNSWLLTTKWFWGWFVWLWRGRKGCDCNLSEYWFICVISAWTCLLLAKLKCFADPRLAVSSLILWLKTVPYIRTAPDHEAFFEPSQENYSPICPFRNEETRINSAN